MTMLVTNVLIGLIAGCALLLSVWQWLVVSRLRKEINGLRQQLQQQNSKEAEKKSFSQDLSQAERVVIPTQETLVSHAERYRYVASLAGQGVDAKGIAAALQLAPAEVEQLMQLARLKKRDQDVEH